MRRVKILKSPGHFQYQCATYNNNLAPTLPITYSLLSPRRQQKYLDTAHILNSIFRKQCKNKQKIGSSGSAPRQEILHRKHLWLVILNVPRYTVVQSIGLCRQLSNTGPVQACTVLRVTLSPYSRTHWTQTVSFTAFCPRRWLWPRG